MIHATSLQQLRDFGVTRAAISCGVYDGLHRGHQSILDVLSDTAAAADAQPVVISFEPHPLAILAPERAPKLLLSPAHKFRLMKNVGVAALVVMPFTTALAAVEAEAFVTDILLGSGIEVTGICVGEKWRFGNRATGDTALLRALAARHDFAVATVREEFDGNRPISSTRIREAVADGDLHLCERLLGRRFSIMGPVEFGKGLATSDLLYPTANVCPGNKVFPPFGIYAALARLLNGADSETPPSLPGILYLGNSPTYLEAAPSTPFVEMHIFDFHADLYGRHIEVEFLDWIREDRKFDTVEALGRQIEDDVRRARQIHAER